MSIKAQMARSTANITGVTGETPSGGGTPGPASGSSMPNKKASKLTMVGTQGLEGTRKDTPKLVSAPQPGGNKVDQKWKGAPTSVMHAKAGPPPGP
jgi:hypothetical protein